MTEDRQKPVWAWIVALLIGLPVLYVASFGPACWLDERLDTQSKCISVVYYPVIRLANRFVLMTGILTRIANFGARSGATVDFSGSALSWWYEMPGASSVPPSRIFIECSADDESARGDNERPVMP
jgi:hypothetical protein